MGDISKMSIMSNVYDSAMEDSELSMYYSFSTTQNKTIEAESSHLNATLEAVQMTPDIKTVIKKTSCISPLRVFPKNVLHLQGLQGFCSTPNSKQNEEGDLGVNILDTSKIDEIITHDKKILDLVEETENKENLFGVECKDTVGVVNKSNAFCETQSVMEAKTYEQSTIENHNTNTSDPSQSDPDSVITVNSDCSNIKNFQDKNEVSDIVLSHLEKSKPDNAQPNSNKTSEIEIPNVHSTSGSSTAKSTLTFFDSLEIDDNIETQSKAFERFVLNCSNPRKSFTEAGDNFLNEQSIHSSIELKTDASSSKLFTETNGNDFIEASDYRSTPEEHGNGKENETGENFSMSNRPKIDNVPVHSLENCDVSPMSGNIMTVLKETPAFKTSTQMRNTKIKESPSKIGKLNLNLNKPACEVLVPSQENVDVNHKTDINPKETITFSASKKMQNVKVHESPSKIGKPKLNLNKSASKIAVNTKSIGQENDEDHLKSKKPLAIKKSLLAHVENNIKIRNTRRTLCPNVSNKSDKNEPVKTSSWQAELKRVCKDIKLAEKEIRTRGTLAAPVKSPALKKVEKLQPRKSTIPMPEKPASKTPYSSPRRASLKMLKGMERQKVEPSKQSTRRTLLLPSVSHSLRNSAAVSNTNSPSRRNIRRSIAPLAGSKPVLPAARKSLYRENGSTKLGVLAVTKSKIISTKTTLNSPKCMDIKKKLLRRSVIQTRTVESNQTSTKLQKPLRRTLYKPADNIRLIKEEVETKNENENEKSEEVICPKIETEKKVLTNNVSQTRTIIENSENKLRNLIAGTSLKNEATATKIGRPKVATENAKENRNPLQLKPVKGVYTKEENKCKFCDKKFLLKFALDNHLQNNCSRIPSAELKKILESKTETKSNVEIEAQKPQTPSSKGSSSCTKKVQRILRVPHSGVYKTPNKMITCYSCKINFKNVVDFSEHMLAHSPKSA